MKTTKLIAILLAMFTFMPAFGQKEKNIIYKVGVGELIYTPAKQDNSAASVLKDVADVLLAGKNSKQQPQYAEAVRASIVNGLSKVTRFRAADGPVAEADLAANIPAIYVDGTIANISIVSKTDTSKDSKGNVRSETYYRSNISVTVNLKDAYDGTLINSHTFSVQDDDNWRMTSGEKAVSKALDRLAAAVPYYYNHLYPLHASIVERGEVKKDKQKEVYIDLGAPDGAYKGQQFDVFSVKTIAGKEAKTAIGRLKIEEVEGDEISLCKVTKGSDKIKTALDEGQTLVITSRQ